jgi:hypothetical protein
MSNPSVTYGDNQQINEIENLWDHTYDWGYISNDGDKAIIRKTQSNGAFYYDFNTKTEVGAPALNFDVNDNLSSAYFDSTIYHYYNANIYNMQNGSQFTYTNNNITGMPRVYILGIQDGINVLYAKERSVVNYTSRYDIYSHKISDLDFSNDDEIFSNVDLLETPFSNTFGMDNEYIYTFMKRDIANRTGNAILLDCFNTNLNQLSLQVRVKTNDQWISTVNPKAYYLKDLPPPVWSTKYYIQGCVSGNNKMFAAQEFKMDSYLGFSADKQGIVIADISTANNTNVSSYERKLLNYNLVVPVDFDYSGRYLLFTAEINGVMQVGVYDTTNDSVKIISKNSKDNGNADSYNPSISADGQTILYMTRATNLGPNMPRGGAMS